MLLREESQTTKSQTKKKKLTKRLKVRGSVPANPATSPEWMILEVIPVHSAGAAPSRCRSTAAVSPPPT